MLRKAYENSIPIIPHESRSLLDVGCGDGKSLLDAGLRPDLLSVGIDINFGSLRESRQKLPSARFVLASGDRLAFCDESFDAYISRVSWPYMDIPQTAREAHRVLKKGGFLWVKFHPFGLVLGDGLRSAASLNVRDVIFRAYVVLNGLVFHFTGKNFRFPFGRKRCESFQTARAIERVLIQTGFRDVRITCGDAVLASARK